MNEKTMKMLAEGIEDAKVGFLKIQTAQRQTIDGATVTQITGLFVGDSLNDTGDWQVLKGFALIVPKEIKDIEPVAPEDFLERIGDF